MSESPLDFEILGPIRRIEPIAIGRGVRLAGWLKQKYGGQ
jgi:hypothetical protein